MAENNVGRRETGDVAVLSEAIYVELTNERLEVGVPEVLREMVGGELGGVLHDEGGPSIEPARHIRGFAVACLDHEIGFLQKERKGDGAVVSLPIRETPTTQTHIRRRMQTSSFGTMRTNPRAGLPYPRKRFLQDPAGNSSRVDRPRRFSHGVDDSYRTALVVLAARRELVCLFSDGEGLSGEVCERCCSSVPLL